MMFEDDFPFPKVGYVNSLEVNLGKMRPRFFTAYLFLIEQFSVPKM